MPKSISLIQLKSMPASQQLRLKKTLEAWLDILSSYDNPNEIMTVDENCIFELHNQYRSNRFGSQRVSTWLLKMPENGGNTITKDSSIINEIVAEENNWQTMQYIVNKVNELTKNERKVIYISLFADKDNADIAKEKKKYMYKEYLRRAKTKLIYSMQLDYFDESGIIKEYSKVMAQRKRF